MKKKNVSLIIGLILLLFFIPCFNSVNAAGYEEFNQVITQGVTDSLVGSNYVSYQGTLSGYYDGFITWHGLPEGEFPEEVTIEDEDEVDMTYSITDYGGRSDVMHVEDGGANNGYFYLDLPDDIGSLSPDNYFFIWVYLDYSDVDWYIEIRSLDLTEQYCIFSISDHLYVYDGVSNEQVDSDPAEGWVLFCIERVDTLNSWMLYVIYEDTDYDSYDLLVTHSSGDYSFAHYEAGYGSGPMALIVTTSGTGDLYVDSLDYSESPGYYHEDSYPVYYARPRYLEEFALSGVGYSEISLMNAKSGSDHNSTMVNMTIMDIDYLYLLDIDGVCIGKTVRLFNWTSECWATLSGQSLSYTSLNPYYNGSMGDIRIMVVAIFENYSAENKVSWEFRLNVSWMEYHIQFTENLWLIYVTNMSPYLALLLIPTLVVYELGHKWELENAKSFAFMILFVMNIVGFATGLVDFWVGFLVLIGLTLVMMKMVNKGKA